MAVALTALRSACQSKFPESKISVDTDYVHEVHDLPPINEGKGVDEEFTVFFRPKEGEVYPINPRLLKHCCEKELSTYRAEQEKNRATTNT